MSKLISPAGLVFKGAAGTSLTTLLKEAPRAIKPGKNQEKVSDKKKKTGCSRTGRKKEPAT